MSIVNVNVKRATHKAGKPARPMVGVRLTPGTLASLDAYAAGQGITRSNAAARLLAQALRGV